MLKQQNCTHHNNKIVKLSHSNWKQKDGAVNTNSHYLDTLSYM